jgi:succinyl-diaminopimelate desuccinylase
MNKQENLLNNPTIKLAQELIRIPSTSPDQSQTQKILTSRLIKLGFTIQENEFFGCYNFWARLGKKQPLLVFSGHSDVVPPGDLSKWSTSPFEASIRDKKIFGRGASDMKGSIAAMITAVESFIETNSQDLPFSIGFLITGDEETGGRSAKAFLDKLAKEGTTINYCLVGEPTSINLLGDTVKIGRRGSLSGQLTVTGKQGHVGYPHLANNALHNIIKVLNALTIEKWNDTGEFFKETTFQVTSLNSGIAANIIPGEASATFNLRHSQHSSAETLINKIEQIIKATSNSEYKIDWSIDAKAFLTNDSDFKNLVLASLEKDLGIKAQQSTDGGTSDARFFAEHNVQVIEFGPVGKTIHQIDENISLADLVKLSEIYKNILLRLKDNVT